MPVRFTTVETRESPAHKKSSHTARTRKRAEAREAPLRFIAVDGEGVTLPDGTHRYVLLSCGDRHVKNPAGLTWKECFEFLYSEYERIGSTGTVYCGFFLGYDFTQILRSLPEDRARMLLTVEGRIARKPRTDTRKRQGPFPVRHDGWEFDILANKRLKIRPEGKNRWMSICDTGSFFQKSFLSVINPSNWSEPVVTQEEYDVLAEGKSRRASAVLDDSMLRYNALENAVLPRVLGRLDSGFRELGIALKPDQWYGPGQAAQEWLKSRAITSQRVSEVVPAPALEAARSSYYGGWFEIMAHGLIPGTTWEYDINSAYPYVISRLPCLEHGQWTSDTTADGLTLVYARVEGKSKRIGAMLHRNAKGNILRPKITEGWYWEHEILAAKRAGVLEHISEYSRWSYVPCACPPPFREVRDIYALRQKVGKKTPLGIACKMVPNSLYGKFAQSVGSPKYANPVYASLITAGCRTMILEAIATHPHKLRDVVMVATDGVYFRTPHPGLSVSKELGDFESEHKENLFLFKPGVYWDDATRWNIAAGEAPVFKARGVSARDFGGQLAEIERQFREMGVDDPWPHVEFPVTFAMTTALLALKQNNWDRAGQVIRNPTAKQSSEPLAKRCNIRQHGDILVSEPWTYGTGWRDEYEPSHPYTKKFGIEDPFSQENYEATGIGPDGLTVETVREALGQKD